ncbi:hypothetical protein RRG08_061705 [Elysia crispata]|uniref:Uncharacterized protein n=1 Tax=Elysia crispata TaxID=231223 RepID=A0AAE0Y844_9GAST|nr:hypothetical protein RRG08_061705 [Elysia crispata]
MRSAAAELSATYGWSVPQYVEESVKIYTHQHGYIGRGPVVKKVKPTIKTGRKWEVVKAVSQAKECLKIKEVIGQTQTDRKGLGSSTAKRWSNVEGKEKRNMVINEIRLNENSRRIQKAVQLPQLGSWSNKDNALQKSLTWNAIWHMAPLRISFLIRSVYDLLPSNANLARWGKKEDSICALCQDHKAYLELMQNCALTGAIHMET